MAGVSTQFSIQDRMTSRLNTMTSAAERLNRSLDTTDAHTAEGGAGPLAYYALLGGGHVLRGSSRQ